MWVTVVWLGRLWGHWPWHQNLSLLLFWNLFSLNGYLAQPRYSREDLGPSPKQCALPSLSSGWEEMGGKVEKMGGKVEEMGEGRKGELKKVSTPSRVNQMTTEERLLTV